MEGNLVLKLKSKLLQKTKLMTDCKLEKIYHKNLHELKWKHKWSAVLSVCLRKCRCSGWNAVSAITSSFKKGDCVICFGAKIRRWFHFQHVLCSGDSCVYEMCNRNQKWIRLFVLPWVILSLQPVKSWFSPNLNLFSYEPGGPGIDQVKTHRNQWPKEQSFLVMMEGGEV